MKTKIITVYVFWIFYGYILGSIFSINFNFITFMINYGLLLFLYNYIIDGDKFICFKKE